MSQETSAIGRDEAVRFQRDLYLYRREAHTLGSLPLTARGYVARPAVRQLRSVLAAATPEAALRGEQADLAEGEEPRLVYLRRLLERLGLLADPGGSRLMATGRGEMARFLAHPLAERLRICARLWVAGGWWPDRLNPGTEPPRLLAPAPPRIALARRRLLETLAGRPPGEAVVVPPATLSPAKNARAAKPARAAATDGESETLRAALLGPLAWMGFVALDDAPSGREPTACRVGVAMQSLVDAADTGELIERSGRVVVQPDLTIIAYPPLTALLLLTLDTCAEAVALDVVARYRLTRDALSRARAAGWTAQEAIARLEGLIGAPLPANVRATLSDWERHVERLRLTPDVSLIETPTPALLDALLADRAARQWGLRRLTSTAALLAPEYASEVRSWLLRRGELPAWVRDAPAADSRKTRSPL